MTKDQLAVYRKALTALAATVERGLAHDQRAVMHLDEPDLSGGLLPSTEEVLDSGAMEVATGLMATEERMLAEVDAALARIAAGTFGECARCGKPIAQSRLDAIPYARNCVPCAKVAESAT